MKSEKIDIFCPICMSMGYRKLIARVDKNAHGTLYLYCKGFSNGTHLTHKGQEITIEVGQGAVP